MFKSNSRTKLYCYTGLAQLVERRTLNPVVVGSSPTFGTILFCSSTSREPLSFIDSRMTSPSLKFYCYCGNNRILLTVTARSRTSYVCGGLCARDFDKNSCLHDSPAPCWECCKILCSTTECCNEITAGVAIFRVHFPVIIDQSNFKIGVELSPHPKGTLRRCGTYFFVAMLTGWVLTTSVWEECP